MGEHAQIFASARNFLDYLNFRADPAPFSSKAEERGVTKLEWLDSRQTSFGEYFDPLKLSAPEDAEILLFDLP